MNSKTFYTLAAVGLIGLGKTFATDITVTTPGSVESLVGEMKNVTELTLTGEINAGDLFFLGQEMPDLKTLDLSGATIVAYDNLPLMGSTFYPASIIPAGAFAGSKVSSISLPLQPGLVIDEAAFLESALTRIDIPANVESIGNSAFAGSKIEEVTMTTTANIGTGVFADCASLTTVNMNGVTEIPDNTFRHCTALAEVNGADALVTIGACAFEGDKALRHFDFGRSLKSIGKSAFAASGLTEAYLKDSQRLFELNEQVFADAALAEISLPDNMSTIGDGAFFGNSQLATIALPEQLITLGNHALVGAPLKKLELPVGLEEIGDYALLGQDNIDDIVLPYTLLYIGDNGMEGMTGLTKIDATSLKEIPELGNDVWAGVDQPKVTLSIAENAPDFGAAEQWKEFSIDRMSGVTGITGIESEEPFVRGRFIGTDLVVESSGTTLEVVRVYDTSGRLLISVEPHDTGVVIDTASNPGGVFVVSVTLENGESSSIKLARK